MPPIKVVGREKSGPFDFDDSWAPNATAVSLVYDYLITRPDQGDWSDSDYCLGLAADLLFALDQAGRCVTYVQGEAHWIWNDVLGCHIPCCSKLLEDGSWCGQGPLADNLVASGDCGEHG